MLPFHGKVLKSKFAEANATERNSTSEKTKKPHFFADFCFYASKTCFDRANKTKPCPNSQFSILLITALTEQGFVLI